MKLYAIRHGETDWNVAKKAQGRTDIELNQTGINQAMLAKDDIQKLEIDLIISSPLKRASKTAQIVSDDKIKISYDERLQERCFGNLEGTSTDDINWEELYNCQKDISTDNIEPVSQLLERIDSLLNEIKEKYSNKTLLLVTHGGTLRAINACINGIPESNTLASQGYRNCEIREFNI